MTIPTSDIINYNGGEWEDYLNTLCLYDIFMELCEEYKNQPKILTGIIRYIIWAYSIDSSKIVLRQEWVQNKKRIFKAADLPISIEQDIVYFKNKTVLYTIKKWLNFQGEENYTTWTMLNDLISEMRVAANLPVLKSTGEIDYKTKMDCASYVIELMVKKSEIEQKFIQNNDKLKEAYKEVSHLNSKQSGSSFGFETMLKENQS